MRFIDRTVASSRYPIRGVLRIVLGPLAIGVAAGIEFAGRGAGVSLLAAYVAFFASQWAVRLWSLWHLHRARARLAAARARSTQLATRR